MDLKERTVDVEKRIRTVLKQSEKWKRTSDRKELSMLRIVFKHATTGLESLTKFCSDDFSSHQAVSSLDSALAAGKRVIDALEQTTDIHRPLNDSEVIYLQQIMADYFVMVDMAYSYLGHNTKFSELFNSSECRM
jgi:hypothetical protein